MIWLEINTPSGQIGPLAGAYQRGVVGMAHALLGAAFVAPLGLYGLAPAYLLGLVYWLAKERGDLRRGGEWRDGAEDAIMVSLGAFYGPWWWPGAVLATGGLLMWLEARK